jgi:hypothetical protein
LSTSVSLRAWLATLATFLGSTLLFSLEPYVGKLLLPAFGGTPLLWNSCMVFFQVALLLGYGLAMLLVRHLSVRQQVATQALLLCALFVAYPRGGNIIEITNAAPGVSLVVSLTRHVLLTFVALAALTTLVQSWLTADSQSTGENPYRLYAASNAGSMFGLFAYPMLFEPWLSLTSQRSLFLVLLAVVILAVAALGFTRAPAVREVLNDVEPNPPHASHITLSRATSFTDATRWRVIALTAVPSSLLLSVTNYILTDVASLPLFWVMPLALYLITFIVAFGTKAGRQYPILERVWTLLVLFIVVALAAEATSPASVLIPVHLLVFFIASLLCHTRVASLAPDPAFLPQFYLAVSIGGAIGGMLTLLIPPLVTNRMIEYPIALVLSAVALTVKKPATSGWIQRAMDVGIAAALVLISSTLFYRFAATEQFRWAPLLFAPAALFVLNANERGPIFGVRLGALFVASLLVPSVYGTTLFGERSFFGRVRVSYDPKRDAHILLHGSTVHGIQRVSTLRGCEPATYYHRTGPVGSLLASLAPAPSPRRVALVGVGSGALACYAREGEQWDLYELDPVVSRVASDTAFFTFLAHAKSAGQRTILGDARLALERDTAARYDILIVDAFSSDAIPIHLLTREAVAGYVRHLTSNGILLFHISNRFFELRPVLSSVLASTPLQARIASDLQLTATEITEQKYISEWVIAARPGAITTLDARWTPLPASSMRVWTDDYSNPLGALRFVRALTGAGPQTAP